MTQELKQKQFVQDLRRVLYLMQILKYNLEWLKMGDICPPLVKNGANGVFNSINHLMTNMRHVSSHQTWAAVQTDLNRDEVHDISLLLETVAGVKNVAEIVEIINNCKTETA